MWRLKCPIKFHFSQGSNDLSLSWYYQFLQCEKSNYLHKLNTNAKALRVQRKYRLLSHFLEDWESSKHHSSVYVDLCVRWWNSPNTHHWISNMAAHPSYRSVFVCRPHAMLKPLMLHASTDGRTHTYTLHATSTSHAVHICHMGMWILHNLVIDPWCPPACMLILVQ